MVMKGGGIEGKKEEVGVVEGGGGGGGGGATKEEGCVEKSGGLMKEMYEGKGAIKEGRIVREYYLNSIFEL